jgi:polysaccharide pyruvyl transferase WcaK-like protein
MSDELRQVFLKADFMLHGSGPSVVAQNHLQSWRNNTNKPYGIYGVTIQTINDDLHDLLSNSSFVFTRETISLQNLKDAKVTCPNMAFTPDATFALEILDDEKGLTFLRDHELQENEFICIVPRLRYTPYFQFKPNVNWSQEKIDHVNSVNEATKEKDHQKLRTVITHWVHETGKKVLVCPEMTYALDIIPPLVVDPLPDDVKKNVVARNTYWITDEAASVYKRAHTIVSMECHSPIIAAANETPCFYVRQPTDTIKGEMWRDVGLHDWIFEIDDVTGDDIYARLKEVNGNYEKAQQYLQSAIKFVQQRHKDTMDILQKQVV